jgi:hypothetical protein
LTTLDDLELRAEVPSAPPAAPAPAPPAPSPPPPVAPIDAPATTCRIADIQWRQPARVAGQVRSVTVRPWADVATLECTLVDDSGGVTVVFLGRRRIGGVKPGTRMTVEGMVGAHDRKLAILNPVYVLDEVPGVHA